MRRSRAGDRAPGGAARPRASRARERASIVGAVAAIVVITIARVWRYRHLQRLWRVSARWRDILDRRRAGGTCRPADGRPDGAPDTCRDLSGDLVLSHVRASERSELNRVCVFLVGHGAGARVDNARKCPGKKLVLLVYVVV